VLNLEFCVYFLEFILILALMPACCYGFYDAVGLLTRFVSSSWLVEQESEMSSCLDGLSDDSTFLKCKIFPCSLERTK
jgi:hypothetical protein